MTARSLKDRAMLVKFTDRVWIGGTKNNTASADVEAAAGAKKGTGYYWQYLVPRAALKERVNIGANARIFHDTNTLPWMGGGVRILPAANFNEYMKGMRQWRAKADAAAKKFCADYRIWKDEAKRTQGSLFDPAKYPSESEIADKFGFDIDVLPLPSVADWRVDIGDEQAKELIAEAEQKMQAIHQDGIAAMFKQLQLLVGHAHERLSDEKAIFRDSLIGNIKDLIGRLGRMNVTNDPRLEELRKQTEDSFKDVQPEALRTDPAARAKGASAAAAIMRRMEGFMGQAAKPILARDEDVSQALADPVQQALKEKREEKNRRARERRASKKKS